MKTKTNSVFDYYSNVTLAGHPCFEIPKMVADVVADTRRRVPRTPVTEKFHREIDELERLGEEFRRETEKSNGT